ncbi:MAG: FmdB family zinc ribbon protein [Actinomycetota bacterium]
MPIYEYRCLKCGHQFEKLQKIADRPVSRCEKCNERVTRVFHPVAIHFKGSGFYSTDYGKKGIKAPARTEKNSGDKPKEKNDNKPQKKVAAGSKEN